MMEQYDDRALQTPPHSKDAEQSVLGAVLLDDKVLDDLSGLIEADYFYYPEHVRIFTAMQSMTGQAIDVVTLTDKDPAIDIDYLIELAESTPGVSNAVRYAGIVAERKKERDLLSVSYKFQEIVRDQDITHAERIEQAQTAFTALSSERRADTQVGIKSSLVAALAAFEDAFNGLGLDRNIKTGLESLDNRINGFRPGDLVVLAGRPAMGKTSLAMNMVRNAAQHHGKTMVFSLEMPHLQLSNRLISAAGSVSMDIMRNPALANAETWPKIQTATLAIMELPLVIDDQGGLSIMELSSRARREHRKGPLKMIMVDYLQLMTSGKSENRTQEISAISQGLKNLAKELDCPVVALSQLNRGLESRSDKRPMMSDLRESGAIEQDADIILFIYRDEVYYPDSECKGLAEIITAKFRDGATGTDFAAFRGEFNRFENTAFKRTADTQTAGFSY